LENLKQEKNKRGKRKTRVGVVTSDKMDKTVVVEFKRTVLHPLYKKVIRISNKFKAHDEENKCKVGDKVEITETRPLSRDKRFRVVRIIGAAKVSTHDLPKQKEKTEEDK